MKKGQNCIVFLAIINFLDHLEPIRWLTFHNIFLLSTRRHESLWGLLDLDHGFFPLQEFVLVNFCNQSNFFFIQKIVEKNVNSKYKKIPGNNKMPITNAILVLHFQLFFSWWKVFNQDRFRIQDHSKGLTNKGWTNGQPCV